MGDWPHGAWALYSVLAWEGRSERLDHQASHLHMGPRSWVWMGSRCEESWSRSSPCVCCFLKPRDSERWCWCPGAGAGLKKNTFPLVTRHPWEAGWTPLVLSWLAIASRLSSGFGSGHCVTCPLPVSLKIFISWLIWKILHGCLTWSQCWAVPPLFFETAHFSVFPAGLSWFLGASLLIFISWQPHELSPAP